MKGNLIAACLLCLGVTSCNSDLTSGQSTLSPNKKWFVRLETKSGDSTNGCTRISVYNTDVYPALKTKPDVAGTLTALFNVPIEFEARFAELKWNPTSTVLRIEQPAANTKPPMYYSLDLNSFSFSKVEK
jgi:hypothetical protein